MKDHTLNKRDSGEIFVSAITKKTQIFIENIKKLDIVHFIGILFVIYTMNSYFGLPRFDSQPFPILVAITFLAFRIVAKKGEIKTPILFFLIGLLSITGIFLGSVIFSFRLDMLLFRGLVNYLSMFIYLAAFYEYIKEYGFPIKVLVFINCIWLFVALIQLFVPGIVDMFVASRTSPGRGLTSLSPEPATFGIYLFFISWIYLIVTDYKPPSWLKVMIAVNLFSIFFLAVSAITIVMVLVSLMVYVIYKIKELFTIKGLIFISIVIGILSLVIFVVLEGSRMERLFVRIIALDFEGIMQTDRSVNSRIGHQILPIMLFFENLGLPGGLQYFVANIKVLDPYMTELLWGNIDMDKIMSWNSTMIYELGLFGVFIWIVLFTFLLNGTYRRIWELILLFIVLFTSVPLSYPLIPLIFVIFYMTNSNYSQRKKHYLAY